MESMIGLIVWQGSGVSFFYFLIELDYYVIIFFILFLSYSYKK
jgi:hypothetical protein